MLFNILFPKMNSET